MPLPSRFHDLLPRLRPQLFQAAEDQVAARLALPYPPSGLSQQTHDSTRLAAMAPSEIARTYGLAATGRARLSTRACTRPLFPGSREPRFSAKGSIRTASGSPRYRIVMPATRDRRGMTLVEVMVSALVLGVMAVAVLSSSTLLAKMSREASDQLAQVQGSRSGLDNNDITAFDSLAVGTYSQSVDARGIATTGGAYTRTVIVDQPAGGAKRIRVLMSKN
ncbi:MAG: hypothetical protein C0497_07330 [Gemmatimonas sp.]|nr:hypothetical protein [Gemmatimonas sp.]